MFSFLKYNSDLPIIHCICIVRCITVYLAMLISGTLIIIMTTIITNLFKVGKKRSSK